MRPHFASSGRTFPFVPDEAFEVIGEIGHADFHLRTFNADGTDKQGHAVFLHSKDMLDR